MDWLDALRRGADRDAVGSLVPRGLVAEHVRIRTATIACAAEGDGYLFNVICTLDAERPEDRRPLALDLTASSLEWLATASDVTDRVDAIPIAPSGRSLVIFTLRAGCTWRNAQLALAFRWYPVATAQWAAPLRYCILPDFLPPFLGGVEPLKAPLGAPVVPQAILQLTQVAPDLAVAFIPDGTDEATSVDPCLQIAFAHESPALDLKSHRISLGGSGADGLSLTSRKALNATTARMVDFLGRELGHAYGGRGIVLLEKDWSRLPFVFGSLTLAKPESFGIGNPDPLESRVGEVRTLCGIWWGAGCRVQGGVAGPAVCAAMGNAMGLRWLASDESQWDRHAGPRLEYFTKEYMRRGECDADGRNARARTAKAAQVAFALSLFSRVRDDAKVGSLLRELTQRYWGKIVGAQTMIAELRGVGVEVPAVISAA